MKNIMTLCNRVSIREKMRLEDYIESRNLKHITPETKEVLLSKIGDVTMKESHKIPDLIKTYFLERLKYIDYERMFEDWFTSVDNACMQLGYGYTFRYRNVKIGRYSSEPCHWGYFIQSFQRRI